MATREELFLKKLNDNSVDVPLPVTRKEKLLYELAGANGLGIELPTVSSADDGKVLTVTNGLWGISGDGGSERTLIYDGTINITQSPQSQSLYIADFTPLTSDFIRDTLHVTYDGTEYIMPRLESIPAYGEEGNSGYVYTTYPIMVMFTSATSGGIQTDSTQEGEHQIKIEADGTGSPIVVDFEVPELVDKTNLTNEVNQRVIYALMGIQDPAIYTVRLVVGDEDIYTPPDYYYTSGDMAGQYLCVNFTADGEPWYVYLHTMNGAKTLRSGHAGTAPN